VVVVVVVSCAIEGLVRRLSSSSERSQPCMCAACLLRAHLRALTSGRASHGPPRISDASGAGVVVVCLWVADVGAFGVCIFGNVFGRCHSSGSRLLSVVTRERFLRRFACRLCFGDHVCMVFFVVVVVSLVAYPLSVCRFGRCRCPVAFVVVVVVVVVVRMVAVLMNIVGHVMGT